MTDIIEVPVSKPNADPGAMTLAEARAVPWIKEKPRPMGELLDSGYLTTDKLEWAVRYAYSSRMRNAAAMLLGQLSIAQPNGAPEPKGAKAATVTTPMPISAARTVRWPFYDRMRDVKGRPIGELLDQRLLTLKDLSYAVENARDNAVRQAAASLILDRLAQAEPPAGPMRVVKSERRSFSEYRQLQIVLIQGILLGILIAAFLAGAVWWLWTFVPVWADPATTSKLLSPIGIAAEMIAAGLGLGLGILVSTAMEKTAYTFDKAFQSHRKGQLGEERAVETLRAHLDGDWTLYRNLVLPGKKGGDLDGVLVGSTGVWVLEIKNYSGGYRCMRNRWERQTARGWKLASSNPSEQARRNAVRLHGFLEADDLDQFVKGVVVWANAEGSIEVTDSDTAVWRLNDLEESLSGVRSRKALSPDRVQRIHDKLERLTFADLD